MALFRDEVIIIKSLDFGEKDKIFTMFGRRMGRFSAIAKGVRRAESKKCGHLQTFNICKVSCAKGKTLDIVTEVESVFEIDTRKLDSNEFERLGFLGLMLDKFLPEDVAEPDIFSLVSDFIQGKINEVRARQVMLDILQRLGFSDEKQDKLSYEKLKLYIEKVLDRA